MTDLSNYHNNTENGDSESHQVSRITEKTVADNDTDNLRSLESAEGEETSFPLLEEVGRITEKTVTDHDTDNLRSRESAEGDETSFPLFEEVGRSFIADEVSYGVQPSNIYQTIKVTQIYGEMHAIKGLVNEILAEQRDNTAKTHQLTNDMKTVDEKVNKMEALLEEQSNDYAKTDQMANDIKTLDKRMTKMERLLEEQRNDKAKTDQMANGINTLTMKMTNVEGLLEELMKDYKASTNQRADEMKRLIDSNTEIKGLLDQLKNAFENRADQTDERPNQEQEIGVYYFDGSSCHMLLEIAPGIFACHIFPTYIIVSYKFNYNCLLNRISGYNQTMARCIDNSVPLAFRFMSIVIARRGAPVRIVDVQNMVLSTAFQGLCRLFGIGLNE